MVSILRELAGSIGRLCTENTGFVFGFIATAFAIVFFICLFFTGEDRPTRDRSQR